MDRVPVEKTLSDNSLATSPGWHRLSLLDPQLAYHGKKQTRGETVQAAVSWRDRENNWTVIVSQISPAG